LLNIYFLCSLQIITTKNNRDLLVSIKGFTFFSAILIIPLFVYYIYSLTSHPNTKSLIPLDTKSISNIQQSHKKPTAYDSETAINKSSSNNKLKTLKNTPPPLIQYWINQEHTTKDFSENTLKELDTNFDGYLSINELGADEATFNRIDKNKDHLVSTDEIAESVTSTKEEDINHLSRPKKLISNFFSKMDKNFDEVITQDEFTGNQTLFDKIDINNDKMITNNEKELVKQPVSYKQELNYLNSHR